MDKPNFQQVNESTLSKVASAALAAKRAADAESRKHRAILEAALIESAAEKGFIKPHQTLVFGYNFGRLAVAVVDKTTTERKTATPKNAITL